MQSTPTGAMMSLRKTRAGAAARVLCGRRARGDQRFSPISAVGNAFGPPCGIEVSVMENERDVTRRDFLKTAAAVAAASALPAAGAPAILANPSPNNVVNYRNDRHGNGGMHVAQVPGDHSRGPVHRDLRHLSAQSQEGGGDHRVESPDLRGLPANAGEERSRRGHGGDAAQSPCPDGGGCLERRQARLRRKDHVLQGGGRGHRSARRRQSIPNKRCKWACNAAPASSTRWPWK